MTQYTAPAHIEILARLAAAKASARAVLDLSKAVAEAEAALDEARAEATAAANLAYGRISSFLDVQRADLDRAEERAGALYVVGDASDEKCEAILALDLGIEIREV